MKRALVGTILGLATSVATSFGQATYYFDTYLPLGPAGAPSGQIVWLGRTPANNNQNLVANLLWQVGTASGIANVGPVGVDQYGYIEDGYSSPNGPGFTQVTFDPGYVANTPINFTINVLRGSTLLGTETWIDPGSAVGAGFNTFSPTTFPTGSILIGLPEPTTLSLAGLGTAGLLLFRKRG